MNLDIRENIYTNLKDEDENEIINTINESVITNDEIILPGLGVILELFWNNLNDTEKLKIASIVREKIRNK